MKSGAKASTIKAKTGHIFRKVVKLVLVNFNYIYLPKRPLGLIKSINIKAA